MEKKEKIIIYFIIVVISIFACIPLMNSNLNMMIDDGIQHICRLMGTYQSLEEGQTFPVIMSKFCNNFGYSWNIFYSPITAYLPLIFKIIGVSFTGCIKLFMFFSVLLSGIFMFWFVYRTTKSSKIGIIAASLYILAPYRLTDMYIRMAFSELVSFTFLPIVFLGLYNLFHEENKKEYILILGAVGIILTHLVMAMYTAIFATIYVIINYKKLKDKVILKKILISILLILMITSFFTLPLLEHKLSADYEVFKEGRMERTEILKAYKLSLTQLIFTSKSDIHIYEIGLVSIVGIFLTPLAIKRIKENKTLFTMYIFSLISAIVSLIMTLKIFPFEYLPGILKMLQFSFRMLEFSSFFLSFVVAINFGVVIKHIKWKDVFIIMLFICILTFTYRTKLNFKENFDETRLWPALPLTSETIRVHAGMASMEYLPCRAFENRKYIENREDKAIVLEGDTLVEYEQKDETNMTFNIRNTKENTKIELPYIYYLGYRVTFERNDGKKVNLKTYETANGFIGIDINEGEEGIIKVKYTGTPIMKISLIMSLVGVFIMLCQSKKQLGMLIKYVQQKLKKEKK